MKTARNTALPAIGLTEWFRPGEYERVATLVKAAKELGVTHLRTGICWADWYTSEGDGWYAWLLPRLAESFNLLPCLLYTPPSLGIAPKFSSPPLCPKTYADFIDVMITRFGDYFEYLELWNRPDEDTEWDSRMDPDWKIFCEMIGGAAYWIRKRNKKAVLPGLSRTNLRWLELMAQRGVLSYIDAVGVHGFPSSPEFGWQGWQCELSNVRSCLSQLGVTPEIWITQTGFSTWRGDEQSQARAFADVMNAPASRVYWTELFDRVHSQNASDSTHSDERGYHYGLRRADGSAKLLCRLWSSNGLKSVVESARFVSVAPATRPRKSVLITGGAGFIGTNLAERLARTEHHVTIYDNLARPGVEQNVAWLQKTFPGMITLDRGDIRDEARVRAAVVEADQVFHLAAQVAVTSSVTSPREDSEINIGGTLNVLEAIRSMPEPPPIIFTSTNKVYGELKDLNLENNCTRYQPVNAALRTGIGEDRPLDFHSPYGCSKGSADQYVLDYARTFRIPAIVFRMSCIYGPHQMGTEDQGWIAHFLLCAMSGEPICICGDGMQVRDALYIDDLVDAFLLAQANVRTLSGQAFNIGGGLGNTVSLIELLKLIESLEGAEPYTHRQDWRPGDQRYYVSDTRKFKGATGWSARVTVREGLSRLHEWLKTAHSPEGQVAGDKHALLAR